MEVDEGEAPGDEGDEGGEGDEGEEGEEEEPQEQDACVVVDVDKRILANNATDSSPEVLRLDMLGKAFIFDLILRFFQYDCGALSNTLAKPTWWMQSAWMHGRSLREASLSFKSSRDLYVPQVLVNKLYLHTTCLYEIYRPQW